jgi:hypothetical protein
MNCVSPVLPFILAVQGKSLKSLMGRVTKKDILHGFVGKDNTFSHLFLLLEIAKCWLSKGKNTYFCLVGTGIIALLATVVLHNHIQSSTFIFHDTYHLRIVHRHFLCGNPSFIPIKSIMMKKFLCVFCITLSTFLQIVDLVKDSPALKG